LPPSGSERVPVLLDCDPGHDDAIAILLALASPELDLIGVTTVAGNQTLEKTTANAIRVLDFAGRPDVPVAAGAPAPLERELRVAAAVHGESGLDGPDLPPPAREPLPAHAVDFIAERIVRSDRPVTLVPTGPLTNVALLLRRRPGAARQVERVVLMGGALGRGNVTAAAEFNIWADPEAAAAVFSSGLDVTMVGLDVTHRALVLPEHAEALRGSGRVGRLIAELLDFYGRVHLDSGFAGSPVHDALALASVARPELLVTEARRITVLLEPDEERGRTVAEESDDARVKAAVDVDSGAFVELLLSRIPTLG